MTSTKPPSPAGRPDRRDAEGCTGCSLGFLCGSAKGKEGRGEPFGAPERRAVVLGLAVPAALFLAVLLTLYLLAEPWIAIVAAFAAALLWYVLAGRWVRGCGRDRSRGK